jgi:hypothetical protein
VFTSGSAALETVCTRHAAPYKHANQSPFQIQTLIVRLKHAARQSR